MVSLPIIFTLSLTFTRWFFLEQRHYKEADIYLLHFKQCMTRAMTLVKMYTVGSLRALAQDDARRLGENVWSQSSL